MKKNLLRLNCNELKISDAPDSGEILLPLWGIDKIKSHPKLKEGTPVLTGETVLPGVFSTVTGTIKGLEPLSLPTRPIPSSSDRTGGSYTAVRIQVSDTEEIDSAVKPEPDYLEKEPSILLEKINRANLGLCEDLDTIKEADTVIVSGIDPDPLQWVYQQILREERDKVLDGLKLIHHVTSARRVILAVPEPLIGEVTDGVDTPDWLVVYPVKLQYPNGLPEILVRNISDTFKPMAPIFFKVEKLVAMVEALKSGNPYAYKVVSVVDKEGAANFRVRIGTPIKNLLELKSCYVKDDDKVIINGPMRGYTCFSTGVPVTDDVDSIYVQHADDDDISCYWNNQCMNCGRCVKVCPVDLDVNLICRYSEFSLFEQCYELGVMICIECGLCAYHCPSGRSLVQLLRLAKKEKPDETESEKMEKE